MTREVTRSVRRSQIEEEIGILAACSLVGMDLPPGVGEGRAVKVHCPFGTVHHADGGIEPAMRIYVESNHVHCFAGCGSFRPVALVAHAFEMTPRASLRELMDRCGYEPSSSKYGDVWTEEVSRAEPDRSRLAEALKTYCRRVDPNWQQRQFERSTAEQLSRCLSLLDFVRSDEAAQQWLAGCKVAMSRALTRAFS